MDIERLTLNIFFLVVLLCMYRILKTSVRQIGYLEFYSLLWAVFILGSQAIGKPYAPTLFTTGVFYFAWLFFLLPSFWVYSDPNEDQPIAKSSLPTSQLLRPIRLAVYALVGLSLLANGWMMYWIMGDLNFIRFGLIALRFQGQQLVIEQSTVFFQLFARNYVIYLPLAIWLYRYKAIRFSTLLLFGLVALLTASITLTRGPVLVCTMSLFTSILVFFRPPQWLTVNLGLGSVTILLGLTMLLATDTEAFQQSVVTYFWGSSSAYETILDGRFPDRTIYDAELYSLDFLNYTLRKLELIRTYPPLVRPYAAGSAPTNVYTYLDAPTLDFGIPGVLLGAAVLGGLAAWLHRKAHQQQSPFVVAYYGFINYAIAISFMNNELIRVNAFLLALEVWLLSELLYRKPTFPAPLNA